MRRVFISLCIPFFFLNGAKGGQLSSYTTEKTSTQSWYADHEWNVSVWGAYVFADNDEPTLENTLLNPVGDTRYDTYLGNDQAWGGGIDAKLFFKRYFGVGIEGYALDGNESYPDEYLSSQGPVGNYIRISHDRHVVGAALTSLTLRYPIGYSRFAPYLTAAGGAIFGGGRVTSQTFSTNNSSFATTTQRSGPRTRAIAQFGGGFEVRLNPHIGVISDFSWNVIDGRKNNFGMVRSGINFAF